MTEIETWEAARKAKAIFMKNIAAWVAVVAFFFGCLLGVLLGGNDDDRSALAVFMASVPLFVIQIAVLATIGLIVNWFVGQVRSQDWYDGNGSAVEMGKVRNRIGTEDEKPGDNGACSRQFMANTILISIIILAFFLTQIK